MALAIVVPNVHTDKRQPSRMKAQDLPEQMIHPCNSGAHWVGKVCSSLIETN